MTISACMIVRNEAKMLPDCLDSLKDWIDEIIIVDTGSTDETKSIAGKYEAKIYDMEWADDFSAARNFSISKATGDWIFVVDADEIVGQGSGERIMEILPDIEEDVIAVDVFNLYGPNRVARSHLLMLRFFRRSSNPRYEGRVHNRPVIGKGKVHILPFRINHLGYDLSPEDMLKKDKRRIKMCTRWTEEEPDKPEAWHHLATALKTRGGRFSVENIPEVIEKLKIGLAACNGDGSIKHIHIQILSQLAWMKYANQDFDESVGYGRKALALKPDYLDAILVIGLAYTYGVGALEGEEWLLRYLREQEAYHFTDKLDCIVTDHANDRKLALTALVDIEDWKEKQPLKSKRTEK
jgi:glycosyltransferase involved in cell wall biosynthesis